MNAQKNFIITAWLKRIGFAVVLLLILIVLAPRISMPFRSLALITGFVLMLFGAIASHNSKNNPSVGASIDMISRASPDQESPFLKANASNDANFHSASLSMNYLSVGFVVFAIGLLMHFI